MLPQFDLPFSCFTITSQLIDNLNTSMYLRCRQTCNFCLLLSVVGRRTYLAKSSRTCRVNICVLLRHCVRSFLDSLLNNCREEQRAREREWEAMSRLIQQE